MILLDSIYYNKQLVVEIDLKLVLKNKYFLFHFKNYTINNWKKYDISKDISFIQNEIYFNKDYFLNQIVKKNQEISIVLWASYSIFINFISLFPLRYNKISPYVCIIIYAIMYDQTPATFWKAKRKVRKQKVKTTNIF